MNGYLSILKENEGVVVFENDNEKEFGYVLVKSWNTEKGCFLITFFDLNSIQMPINNREDLQSGSTIMLHPDKESCYDALIDSKVQEQIS
jgi:hypothetical protein